MGVKVVYLEQSNRWNFSNMKLPCIEVWVLTEYLCKFIYSIVVIWQERDLHENAKAITDVGSAAKQTQYKKMYTKLRTP